MCLQVRKAPSFRDAWAAAETFLLSLQRKNILVGHNVAAADIIFLLHQLRRNQLDLPRAIVGYFDTLRVLQKYPTSPFGKTTRKEKGKNMGLLELYTDMFNGPFLDPHDALADAHASARVVQHPDVWRFRSMPNGVQPVAPLIDGVQANITKVNQILHHDLQSL